MARVSANPDELLTFEHDASEAMAALYDPAITLMTALGDLRANADAKRFLPDIPYIGQDVHSLYSDVRNTASWVGQVGRAFQAADNGDGIVTVDESALRDVERLGNGTFTVRYVNGRMIIDTGDGDDQVQITEVDGGIKIVVNGVERILTGADASNVTLRLGGGNDRLEVSTDVDLHFTIEGQQGMDKLEPGAGDDTIRGGADRDYIDGYSGDDELDGGDGNDVIYAGDGTDTVRGGDGIDYLEGGEGDDTMIGGAHHDIVSGGDGNDRLDGGGGDDTYYAGEGTDTISDYQGNNEAYAQVLDDDIDYAIGDGNTTVVNVDLSGLPGDSAIRIEGSDRFQQRILQDLAMLRSSPDGRLMLSAMDDIHEQTKAIAADWPILGGIAYDGDVITIQEYQGDDNSESGYNGTLLGRENYINQSRSIFENYEGSYTPQRGQVMWQEVPPVVVFFHELAHQYDYGYDTSLEGDHSEPSGDVPNSERQAVGLPVDHDDDPSTPEVVDPDHPEPYTENGLRGEMGLPDRTTYGRP